MLEAVEEENGSSIRTNCKTISTYDVDVVDCCDEGSGVDCHNKDSDNNYDDDDTLPKCLICFETFVNGDAVTTHCSDKSYHRHCIMEWLMKHDNCPYCRRPFFLTTATNSNNDSTVATSVSNADTRNNSNRTSTTMTR